MWLVCLVCYVKLKNIYSIDKLIVCKRSGKDSKTFVLSLSKCYLKPVCNEQRRTKETILFKIV